MREATVRRGSRIRKTIGRVASSASSGNASPTWNVISFTTSPSPAPRPPSVPTASGVLQQLRCALHAGVLVPRRLERLVAYQPTAAWFQRIRETAVEAVRGGPTST